MLNLHDAFLYTFFMALAVFFCRVFPFIVFKKKRPLGRQNFAGKFIAFVESTAPPVTMTVLTFNAVSGELLGALGGQGAAAGGARFSAAAAAIAIAAALTALLHIWKRNALLSIAGGTAFYVLAAAFIQR